MITSFLNNIIYINVPIHIKCKDTNKKSNKSIFQLNLRQKRFQQPQKTHFSTPPGNLIKKLKTPPAGKTALFFLLRKRQNREKNPAPLPLPKC